MHAKKSSRVGRPPRPAADRFREKLVRDLATGCLEYTGARVCGYGVITIGSGLDGSRRMVRAHRFAWELAHGPIPAGLCVLHNCPAGDNPACCEPSHLFLGTVADNNADKARKGRGVTGRLPYGVRRVNGSVNRWRAEVKHGGVTTNVGNFDSIGEAAEAAAAFKRRVLAQR